MWEDPIGLKKSLRCQEVRLVDRISESGPPTLLEWLYQVKRALPYLVKCINLRTLSKYGDIFSRLGTDSGCCPLVSVFGSCSDKFSGFRYFYLSFYLLWTKLRGICVYASGGCVGAGSTSELKDLILPLPCFSVKIKLSKLQKRELCSATTRIPPLESDYRELSFEWSHL